MKVGMIQSNYIPWRGYFDLIDDVDLFIIYDDVEFGQGRKWRNRNRIKTRHGTRWLTVPLIHGRKHKLISEVKIDRSVDWAGRHCSLLTENYRQSPYFDDYFPEFREIINTSGAELSSLNVCLIIWLMGKLKIETRIVYASEFSSQGCKSSRPLRILEEVGASSYLSGPTAEPYTDAELFNSQGIELEFKNYDYKQYPQLWGSYDGNLSVLDLLFNCGPKAREYLKSLKPNRRVRI